jgi:hypothetical protein
VFFRYVPFIAGLGRTAIVVNYFVWKDKQRWLTAFSWLALLLSFAAHYAPFSR